MAKVPHCVKVYRENLTEPYGHGGKWRQHKKFFRKMNDPVYNAYIHGMCDYLNKKPRSFRYPPGKRYTAYNEHHNGRFWV